LLDKSIVKDTHVSTYFLGIAVSALGYWVFPKKIKKMANLLKQKENEGIDQSNEIENQKRAYSLEQRRMR
jgi:hypothetical protein